MRIGSLVTSDTGELGVVVDNHWRTFLIHWVTGNYTWVDEIYLTVEVK